VIRRTHMKQLILVACFSLILLSSCKDQSAKANYQSETTQQTLAPFDYLIVGAYAGECVGNCAQFIKIVDDQVYIDTENNDLFWSEGTIIFDENPLILEHTEHIRKIISNFPTELLTTPSRQFGCPDCDDLGATYLEIGLNGERLIWQIESNSPDLPDYLKSYFDVLNENPIILSEE